ncbi:MAG: hypothetical protein NDI61_11155 [Bdellovibrionaceae bacterium]|nr:hypothetical protein [Pseudobdellovibrionaceae bacterium]
MTSQMSSQMTSQRRLQFQLRLRRFVSIHLPAAILGLIASLSSGFAAGLLVCLLTTHAHAAPDPNIVWQVLETEHFAVIYDSRHYALAEEYARDAERAYRSTLRFFGEAPAKTVLVLDDSSDLANGFATGLPYSQIIAYPVLPSPLDSISDYGDWSQELVTHEFTHVLQFEPAHGLAKPLRWVFGNILRPNMLLPRWYLEGLAVEMETRLSQHGRLRSESAMAIPRAMVEENTLRREDISRLNEISIPDGVGGLRPYLLGGILWNHMIETGGEETVGDLNRAYSRRVPFLINGPASARLGLDYADLLSKTYDHIEARSQAQLAQIAGQGALKSEPFPEQEGFFNHSPAISPDGRYLLFIARTHNQDDRIELVERASDSKRASFAQGKRKTLSGGIGVTRVTWLPDTSGFVFDKVDSFNFYYQYSDLHRYDLKTKKAKRITTGLRAREPAVSPNGQQIVFVQLIPGSTRLAQVNLDGSEFRVLYEASHAETRLSRPEFLSATEVIFVEKAQGQDTFKVISLADGTVSSPASPALARMKGVGFPRRTSEGLLFSSSQSGVENLYLADRNLSRVRAVTNVTTRAFTGDIDPRTRELYFSRLSADGPRLHVAKKDHWLEETMTPPQVGPLLATDWPNHTEEPIEIAPVREDYSAWPYMYPRYWLPFVYWVPDGTYYSASTSAADPLGKHAYTLQASYSTLAAQPSFAGQYINQQTNIAYTLEAADVSEYVYSADLVRRTISASLLGSFSFGPWSKKWSAGVGWNSLQTELSGTRPTRMGPRAFLKYANASQKGYEISPERGGSFLLAHTSYLPELGNINYDVSELYANVFHSKGLPKRHVAYLALNAMYAPRLRNVLLGQSTSAADYGSLLLSNDFVMRGYANGSFLGRTMINANLEYRFPLWYAYQGWGTRPAFLQRLHGALLVDVVTLDGAYFDEKLETYRRARTGSFFVGSGAELRADLTTFYHLPVKLVLGLYYGSHEAAGLGPTSYLGFTL